MNSACVTLIWLGVAVASTIPICSVGAQGRVQEALEGAVAKQKKAVPGLMDDLAAAIVCRADEEGAQRLSSALTETIDSKDGSSASPRDQPWRIIESRRYDVAQLILRRPVTIAGIRARHVGFAQGVVFAYLKGASATEVAKRLGLTPGPSNEPLAWTRSIPSNEPQGANYELTVGDAASLGEEMQLPGYVFVACAGAPAGQSN